MSRNLPTSEISKPKEGGKIVIITAEWNGEITGELERGARETLKKHGVSEKDIVVKRVPGTVELTYAAALASESIQPAAIIVFGSVIRGDTPHFDYVCQSVTQGITHLNSTGKVPVIFGVLTTDNEEQALERIGGRAGHKGVEAAETALRMITFSEETRNFSI